MNKDDIKQWLHNTTWAVGMFFKRMAGKITAFVKSCMADSTTDEYETVGGETGEKTMAWQSIFGKLNNAKKTGMFVRDDKPKSLPLAILFTTIKVVIIVGILACATVGGLVLGVAKAYVDTTPMLDISELTNSSRTSYVYDKDGELITTFAGMEYREWASIDEIPDMLKNAVVAIEDVRFYKHDGVDYKRLVSAVINTFLNKDTHGGSTITQQLIKNTILTNIQSYKRKIQEAYLALELESVSGKEAILEAYLNQVFLGDQNYGIKAATRDYFGKELDTLTIRECAMIAGMIQKPNGYNPRLNTYVRIDAQTGENRMNRTNDRTDVVIRAMYDAGFITLEQKESALRDTVTIVKESNKSTMYEMAYFIEYAIHDVVTHLLEQRNLVDTTANRTMLETQLSSGGYSIYLTVDSKIQKTVEDEVENYNNYPALQKSSASVYEQENADGSTTKIIQPQAAAVVMDHNSGNLVAIVGGRTQPTQKKSWNRAYMSALQVGSSIKPLTVYGPALDLGMSPASIAYNIPGKISGWGTDTGYPSLGSSEVNIVTMRRGVRSSLNVVAARVLMEVVGVDVAKDYLMKLGVPESNINVDGPGLALGTSGITPVQMAAAFATIANNGVYLEPLSFSKVVDSDGKTILDAAKIREKHRVFKKSTAYLLVSMMEDVVSSGTGTRARFDGMTIAGKTGTNSDYSSVCFSGFTPYYSATVWIGHDYPKYVLANAASGGSYAAPLWKNFMSKIHEGLANKSIVDDDAESLGLVRRTVCSVSGLLATDACYADEGHKPITDWFADGNAPMKSCNMHLLLPCCKESGAVATNRCPDTSMRSYILVNKKSDLMKFSLAYLRKIFGNIIFTETPIGEYTGEGYFCHSHAGEVLPPIITEPLSTPSTQTDLDGKIAEAESVISQVETYLRENSNSLEADQTKELETLVDSLRGAMERRSEMLIGLYTRSLVDKFYEYTGVSLK